LIGRRENDRLTEKLRCPAPVVTPYRGWGSRTELPRPESPKVKKQVTTPRFKTRSANEGCTETCGELGKSAEKQLRPRIERFYESVRDPKFLLLDRKCPGGFIVEGK